MEVLKTRGPLIFQPILAIGVGTLLGRLVTPFTYSQLAITSLTAECASQFIEYVFDQPIREKTKNSMHYEAMIKTCIHALAFIVVISNPSIYQPMKTQSLRWVCLNSAVKFTYELIKNKVKDSQNKEKILENAALKKKKALKILRRNPSSLYYKDREIVLAALERDGWALRFAHPDKKRQRDRPSSY